MPSLSCSRNPAREAAEGCERLEWRASLLRVLVVGDDEVARGEVADHLALHGCSALQAKGVDALHRLAAGKFSLVILDLNVPSPGNLTLLASIRPQSCVPVIVTARTVSGDNLVASIAAGADDVLQRPFISDELVARALAILRRQELGRMAAGAPLQRGFRFRGWELRQRTRTLRDPGGAIVQLTKAEFALLAAFLKSPRRPLSRPHLIRATRAHEDIVDRSIDVQVMRLRRKLEREPTEPRLIRTVRGFGYCFDEEVEVLV